MNKPNFYIVDSVKGGCGKTSIALWKAMELSCEKINVHDKNLKSKKVCYLDLDLLGTSTAILLGDNTNGTSYLNDLFTGDRTAVRKLSVKRDLNIYYEEAENKIYHFKNDGTYTEKKIGLILSNPNQNKKNLFRVGYPTDGHHIDYDFFARRINELIKELIDGGFTDFVIDMPPNSDPYTDSIFDLLLHQKPPKEENDKIVSLLLISSFDHSHRTANISWFDDLISKDHSWYPFDYIELYFNDVRNCITKDETLGEPSVTPKEISEAFVNSLINSSQYQKECVKQFVVRYNSTLSAESINQNGIEQLQLVVKEIN